MNEHMRDSQNELNNLMKEYWRLRHATGPPYVLSYCQYADESTDLYMETLANKLGMQVTSA